MKTSFCILEIVIGLIGWYVPPLRLAFTYFVPFCQKDLLDKIIPLLDCPFFHSQNEGGLFETVLFPCLCTSCQSPSKVIPLSASSWVFYSCWLKHWRNVELKYIALFNHVKLPEARQSIVNHLFPSITACWNSCSCSTVEVWCNGQCGGSEGGPRAGSDSLPVAGLPEDP